MSANWFDHAIATIAPRAAARRVLARQAFETLTRGYDGASKGRRTDGWRASGSSADTEIGVAGALLRDRMRDLVRNNPHAAKAVAVLVNNIVGSGIMPRAASGDDKLDRKVDVLFARWTAECDADGQLDFYGLQTLICREMIEAGEVLIRRRLRRASDGLPVPLQLQVLEADFLDATKSSYTGAGRIVQGIEFDPVGKRRAYWLHAAHPGDAWGARQGRLGSRPVPATEIAHVYEKQRTQARGVPWGAPVIRSLRDLDDYEVAELVRKKTEACVTAIVFGDDEAQQGIAPAVVDADGNRVAPIKDAVTADGDVVVPIDVENFGLWLKAAFGQPTTSGTTPKTHTFQSGNWTLPSMAIETAMPEVPRYAMYTGCVCDQLSWDIGAALALGAALGISPPAIAELLPALEAVMVRCVNEQIAANRD